MKTYITVYFGTLLLAMILVPIVSRLAKRFRLVDNPGPRKLHTAIIPRIGGIAFVLPSLALVIPVFFLDNRIGQSFREGRTEFIVLLMAASFIFAVGFIDDLYSIPGRVKLLCIMGASLAICASGATLKSFSVGNWFEVETYWAAWPLTVFWITMVTVCMNFIDGLDGLAAGIAAMVCGIIGLLAFLFDYGAMLVLMLALLGGVTGFLFFNFHPAKIFMGDCGSMFLGFMIGASSIICQAKTSTLVGLGLPFIVLGVPIFDMGFAVIRRYILERRSVFSPDRNHLHHRLLDRGLSQRNVVTVVYAITAISTSIGLFMLTAEGSQTLGFLAGGFLLSFAMYVCARGRGPCVVLKAIRRNWSLAKEVRAVRRNFDDAELRMRNASSLHAWWETVCDMGKQMHFQSIGLWNRREGRYVSSCIWNSPEGNLMTSKTANLTLPLLRNETVEWEIRANIEVNGYLELSGRQAMLLARLMDEFPPPEREEETEALANVPTLHDETKIEE